MKKDICSYCGKKLRNTNWGIRNRNPSGMHDICAKRKHQEELKEIKEVLK